MVTVTTMGVGLADVQLLYKYYLPLEDRANEPFHVEVEVDEDNGLDKLLVKVCSRYVFYSYIFLLFMLFNYQYHRNENFIAQSTFS